MQLAAHQNADRTRPGDYLEGSLAEHADLALCELVFGATVSGMSGAEARQAVRTLRLAYWYGWIDAGALWAGRDEQRAFLEAILDARRACPGLPRRLVSDAELLGRAGS